MRYSSINIIVLGVLLCCVYLVNYSSQDRRSLVDIARSRISLLRQGMTSEEVWNALGPEIQNNADWHWGFGTTRWRMPIARLTENERLYLYFVVDWYSGGEVGEEVFKRAWIVGNPDEEVTQPPPLNSDLVRNGLYRLQDFPEFGTFRLSEGVFKQKLSGTAIEPSVRLVEGLESFSDLNQDGADDAVVVLCVSGGGSGSFFRLAAVLNSNGKPKHVATAALGDRVDIQGVLAVSDVVVVRMLTHRPDDGLCCPTKLVHRYYRFSGDRLVLTTD